MKLLHIDSSIQSDHSVSRKLTQTVVDQWQQADSRLEVVYRDLAANAPNHLSSAVLSAGSTPPEQRNALQRVEAAISEDLLMEFLAANVLVIGAPMYNFSIPSQLKAWLDRVMVAGRTFKYTETGPVGLASEKRAIIVSSRGGIYSAGSLAQTMEHQESYLKVALGFMGITTTTIIRAEGVNMKDKREQAIAAAHNHIRHLWKAAA